MNMPKDIESTEDIELLVQQFYTTAFQDSIIGPIFTEVAKLDLKAHLPVITSFWSSVLLMQGGYKGNLIKKHVDLNTMSKLEERHFDAWIDIWETTVDKNFNGPKAEEAKQRARTMKMIMLIKLRKSEKPGFIV